MEPVEVLLVTYCMGPVFAKVQNIREEVWLFEDGTSNIREAIEAKSLNISRMQ
jgi:hypothetical protein